MPTALDVLRSSIESHNDTFESLLKLIPAKYYLVKDDDGEPLIPSKYQKHSKTQKASKQAVKEASKKARREKLDPANQKSILDIQNEAAVSQSQQRPQSRKSGTKKRDAPSSDHSNSDSDPDAPSNSNSDAAIDADAMDVDTDPMIPMPQPQSISVLREKLHARMSALRRGGNGNGAAGVASTGAGANGASGIGGTTGDGDDEPGDKDSLLEARRKQRAALREKRRKETRERRRAEAEGKKDKDKGKNKEKGKDREEVAKGRGVSTKTQLLVPSLPSSHTTIAFSNTTTTSTTSTTQNPPPTSHPLKTPTNPTLALSQLTSHNQKLLSLPSDKRQTIQERERWAKASARLEGVKVRDDEAQLKKAVKRKEREKVRSRKKWEERKEEVRVAMAARQKKRADNIAMRNERRGEKKGGKGGKGGKARPGFEGKSFAKKRKA